MHGIGLSHHLVCRLNGLLRAWDFVHLLHGAFQELAVVTLALHADAAHISIESSRMRCGGEVLSIAPACKQHGRGSLLE